MDQEVVREEPQLSQDPRLSELFEFIKTDDGVRVLPITVKQTPEDTRLLITIQGNHDTASTIMAQLMAQIDVLHDLAQQADAENDESDGSSIIVP